MTANKTMRMALSCLLLSSTTANAFVAVVPTTTTTSATAATFTSKTSPVSSLLYQQQKRYAMQNIDHVEEASNKNNNKWISKMTHRLSSSAAVSLASAALLLSTSLVTPLIATPAPAHAESKLIGQIAGSGLFFKDTLQIERFDDPKVQGVTLYISNFERPLTERLSKDFLSDPSYASVSCVKTGPIKVADNIATGASGEEVFEESRSLLFKTLRVQRVYDQDKNTVVYVSFNTRLDKNADSNKSRFKSSLCAVSLD